MIVEIRTGWGGGTGCISAVEVIADPRLRLVREAALKRLPAAQEVSAATFDFTGLHHM